MGRTLAQKKSCASCIRYVLIITNCLFSIIAMAIIGVFVWMAVDQVDVVKGVTGTDIVMASVCLLAASACALFLVAIMGIIGAARESQPILALYFVSLGIILCGFLAGAICIAVYNTWLTEPVRIYMETNLRNVYGVNLDNPWNKQVTTSWDKAQKTWRCCSAADKSWAIYQQSDWYAMQPGTPGNGKPYVPESCCRLDSNGQISSSDLYTCQNTRPPDIGGQYPASSNPPVNARGCFETAKDFMLLNEVSWYTGIFGVGIAAAILMLFGISLAICLCVSVRRERYADDKMQMELTLNSRNTTTPQYSNERSVSRTTLPSQPSQYLYSMA